MDWRLAGIMALVALLIGYGVGVRRGKAAGKAEMVALLAMVRDAAAPADSASDTLSARVERLVRLLEEERMGR